MVVVVDCMNCMYAHACMYVCHACIVCMHVLCTDGGSSGDGGATW